jgi:hypothetical protein
VNTVSPEYVPEIVLLPAGAAEELHELVPALDKVAVHSDVAPVVNMTEPLGLGSPVPLVVTVAE